LPHCSQDFLNGVCTNIIHMHKKSLNYYSGNYDQYVQTRAEQEENQMKRYKWEQEQISHMKVRRGNANTCFFLQVVGAGASCGISSAADDVFVCLHLPDCPQCMAASVEAVTMR
jgi:hypothetical protein